MELIETALLTGQRTVTVNNIKIELQPLPRDTRAQRLKMAQKRAKEIYKLLN